MPAKDAPNHGAAGRYSSAGFFFLGGRRFCVGTSLKISEGGTERPVGELEKARRKKRFALGALYSADLIGGESHTSPQAFSWERCRFKSLTCGTCLPNKTNALGTPYSLFGKPHNIYILIR